MALREKITFFRDFRAPDGTGGATYTEIEEWTPQAAQVEEMEPTIEMIATQETLSQAVKVKIRYNPEKEIRLGYKFRWRGFVFNTIRVKVDRIKRFQYLIATAEVETNDRNDGSSNTAFNYVLPLTLS